MALLNHADPEHAAVRAVLDQDAGPYFVPGGILAEVAYIVETRLGASVLDLFLVDIESGAYALNGGEGDLPRIRQLVRRYADLPLGFADAVVVACAERNGGRVLTLDATDFEVVAKEGTITILP